MIKSKQKLTYLPQTLDRYLSLLIGLRDLINGKNWDVSSQDENQMAQNLISHLLQQSSIIENMYGSQQDNLDNKVKLGNAYDLLTQLINDAQIRVWSTQNTVDKLYSFDMPSTGEYQLFVK